MPPSNPAAPTPIDETRRPSVIDVPSLRANPELVKELRSRPGELQERRQVASSIELRAKDDDDEGYIIEGHAAVFDKLSVNLGGFREKIDRGAFRKVLKSKPDYYALFNHSSSFVLGRSTAGTVTSKEDTKGLAYTIDVAPTTYAADLRVLMERDEVNQSSFSFRVGDDTWEEDPETGVLIRTVHEFSELYDVSPCINPAYPDADSGLRTLTDLSLEELRTRAWHIHTGEREATAEERAVIDGLLQEHSTVSPWTAERTFRAIAKEPELLAAVPGKRAKVEFESQEESSGPTRAELNQRRLRQRERLLGA